jgi:hypothetical protein
VSYPVDFLSPANTSLDLDTFVFEQSRSEPEIPFTNFLLAYQAAAPPVPNERYPDSFSLNNSETSISRTDSPDKTYIPELNLFILTRHLPLLRQIQHEISDPNFPDTPHGGYHSSPRACPGPLCKRRKRLKMQESNLLNNHRKAYKSNSQAKISPILTNPAARYRSLKARNKPYAGPEPLLFLYTALELARIPRSNLSKNEQHQAILVKQNTLYAYMLSIFSPDIQ